MSIRRNAMNRRRFLGALGTAAALPLLPALGKAQGDTPKRLVVFATPNNWVGREYWLPAGSGNNFALQSLPPMLSPLAPHKDKLLLLGDMVNQCHIPRSGKNDSHAGIGHMLTGHHNIPWPGDSNNENHYWAGGPSVDQFVASRLGVRALTLGASRRSTGESGGSRISYRAANEPVTPQHVPADVYAQLFGGGVPVDARAELGRRQSLILNHTERRLSNLGARFGRAHGARIERHLDAVSALRSRIEGQPAACSATAPEATNGYPSEIARQIDLLTEALACGITQVAALQCGNSGGAESYSGGLNWNAEPDMGQPSVSLSRSQHVIAHEFDTEPNAANNAARLEVEALYFRSFAYLLERMDSVMESNGKTLLDNSVVLYTKPMGIRHSKSPMLYILGGGAGELNMGRYERHDGEPHNNLLVSVCRLMGMDDVTSFGDERFCTGDLLGV